MPRYFLRADIAANVADEVENSLRQQYGPSMVGLSLRPVAGQRFEVEATLELADGVDQVDEPDERLRNAWLESSSGAPPPRLVRRAQP